MLRIAGIAVFASLLVGVHAGRVQAHARLTKSVPDAGATLAASPTEIRLQFNEAIEARFSKIAIEAKGGTPIATESVSTDPADKKVLIIQTEGAAPARGLSGKLARRFRGHAQDQRQLRIPSQTLSTRAVTQRGLTCPTRSLSFARSILVRPCWLPEPCCFRQWSLSPFGDKGRGATGLRFSHAES